MNSWGPVDRLLEPYYKKDLAEGRITEEEAYFLMQCFLYKTDFHINYNESRKAYDNGVTVMIGGCDENGVPVDNEITDMVLRAYTDNCLVNPKLNTRAGTYSSRKYLQKLTDLILSGNNNIVVENDDAANSTGHFIRQQQTGSISIRTF